MTPRKTAGTEGFTFSDEIEAAMEEDLVILGKDSEDEAWMRAYRYAVSKGNIVLEAVPGRRSKASVIYADAHADAHVNSDLPVAPAQQVHIVERSA